MIMELSDDVFADSSASMALVEPALSENAKDTTLKWSNTCGLGSQDCKMAHKVNDAGM